jgi:nitrous oxide reductase accessory protein NosL
MQYTYRKGVLFVFVAILLSIFTACATSGDKAAEKSSAVETAQASMPEPMAISAGITCGKCGMYPARYPQWQSQIIFTDGTMTPFDGCKCMFNFMNGMANFGKAHTRNDVAVAWVKDFNSGKWINAEDAYYVVGSQKMGPMGKELIPFTDHMAAMQFHKEQGGTMMKYAEITSDVLKSLMGGMKKHGQGGSHMKM